MMILISSYKGLVSIVNPCFILFVLCRTQKMLHFNTHPWTKKCCLFANERQTIMRQLDDTVTVTRRATLLCVLLQFCVQTVNLNTSKAHTLWVYFRIFQLKRRLSNNIGQHRCISREQREGIRAYRTLHSCNFFFDIYKFKQIKWQFTLQENVMVDK